MRPRNSVKTNKRKLNHLPLKETHRQDLVKKNLQKYLKNHRKYRQKSKPPGRDKSHRSKSHHRRHRSIETAKNLQKQGIYLARPSPLVKNVFDPNQPNWISYRLSNNKNCNCHKDKINCEACRESYFPRNPIMTYRENFV